MNIDLYWQLYLTDDSKYHVLDKNLSQLTQWYISKKYDKFNEIWEDIYHDMMEKVISLKNDINIGKSTEKKSFKAWYYIVLRNYLVDLERATKREKKKLSKYQKIVESENTEESEMNEKEILLNFANIMAIQKNQLHVKIFVDFVNGKSYSELSSKHGISKDNARKIIERMRKQCIQLWATDLLNKVNRETATLFGKKKYEAIVALILKLAVGLPDEYKKYIIKILSR